MNLRRYFVLPILLAFFPQFLTAQLQWEQTNGPFGVGRATVLFIALDNSILLGTEVGLYRSTDEGHTWKEVLNEYVSAFTIYNDSRIYVGCYNGKILFSDNNGETWMYQSLLPDYSQITAISVLDTSRIAVGEIRRSWDEMPRPIIFLSETTDGGILWEENKAIMEGYLTPITALSYSEIEIIAGLERGLYSIINDSTESKMIFPHPITTQIIKHRDNEWFVGSTSGLITSTDQGKSWKLTNYVQPVTDLSSNHTSLFMLSGKDIKKLDKHSLEWVTVSSVPQPASRIAVSSRGTIISDLDFQGASVFIDSSSVWRRSDEGIRNASIAYLTTNTNSSIVTNSFFSTKNRGNIWNEITTNLPKVTMPRLIVTNSIGQTACVLDSTLYSWDNVKEEWKMRRNLPLSNLSAEIALGASDEILVAKDSILYYSTNMGEQWDASVIPDGKISQIAIGSNRTLWARLGTEKYLYRSTDQGKNWNKIHPDTAYGMGYGPIVVSHKTGMILISTVSIINIDGSHFYNPRLYLSTDNGESWKKISLNTNGTHYAIVDFCEDNRGTFYFLTEREEARSLFQKVEARIYSVEQTGRWEVISQELPEKTTSLTISPDYYLYAGTSNRGVFRSNRPVADAPVSGASTTTISLTVTPNPITETATLSLYLPQASIVTLQVVDLLGRVISYPMTEQFLEQGTHHLTWSTQAIASGAYFIRMIDSQRTQTLGIVVD